ncbi:MAG: type II toxin-antitoxin system prevent-host-death family antitoxin [Clostridiales Family XIII bacterium]|jgi:anthranilate synthase component 1|nr:type II toxin-antitoxin system prevent-host-death family antitoxin [Clostridiales Family XIII bacterium]
MGKYVNIQEAKTHLSKLINSVVNKEDDVIIANRGVPVVRLQPIGEANANSSDNISYGPNHPNGLQALGRDTLSSGHDIWPRSLDHIIHLTESYNRIPVCHIIDRGDLTPISVFKKLKALSRQCFILESLEEESSTGRYTFIGFDPRFAISCKDGKMTISGGTTIDIDTPDPAAYIKHIIEENKSPVISELPPFTGGLVGYFSYDYIHYSEPKLKLDAHDEEGFKDFDLMLFDKVYAFDNLLDMIYIIYNMPTEDVEENYNLAKANLDQMTKQIFTGKDAIIEPLTLTSELEPLFEKEGFMDMVMHGKHYIKEGDIFQVVLSNRLKASAKGSLFDTYRYLRKHNPSPYMFYFSGADMEIAGASPETLVKLTDRKVVTYPLAGSRPRGANDEEDAIFTEDLLSDEKELAEHNMLVDLGRNDIGKISTFGSVRVEEYMKVLKFSHIMHIGSVVSGQITEGNGAIDAIDAVLPAGTLSGAPKIRACEIINELENEKRGIYGGAIGYICNNGNMDTCIAIRIAYKKNGNVYVRSGAGIVADSDPATEYVETQNKMKAVLNALHADPADIEDYEKSDKTDKTVKISKNGGVL